MFEIKGKDVKSTMSDKKSIIKYENIQGLHTVMHALLLSAMFRIHCVIICEGSYLKAL